MEDQQPDAGDLTDAAKTPEVDTAPTGDPGTVVAKPAGLKADDMKVDAVRADDTKTDNPQTDGAKTDAKKADGTDTAEPDEAADAPGTAEPTEATDTTRAGQTADGATEIRRTRRMRTRRRSRRRLPALHRHPRWRAAAMVAAVVLFVDAFAFAGAALQPYLTDRAQVATKLTVARTAATAISTLWTYTPEDIDKLSERAAKYLGGDMIGEYRKSVEKIAPMTKQFQSSGSTEITGVAVESLVGSEATVIVYTNSTATTNGALKDLPTLQYKAYRMTMRREHGRWLVTRMPVITSMKLTPQM